MDIQTLYNLDDVFYEVGPGRVVVWAVNNVLTSAVGRKTVYEMKNAKTNHTGTITEGELQKRIDEGSIVRTIDEVRTILESNVSSLVESAEKTKRDFLKEKLNRTLNHNKRKAETSIEAMKKKLKLDDTDEETEDEEDESDKQPPVDLKDMLKKMTAGTSWANTIGKTPDDITDPF